jgi:magnesium transporter
MPKGIKKIAARAGFAPGTLVYTGEEQTEEVKITIVEYSGELLEQRVAGSFEERLLSTGKPAVTWIHVAGIYRTENLERIGERFGVHPLILEDILSAEQRPKAEDLGSYIYIALKHLRDGEPGEEAAIEELSLVLGESYVLSFQEGGQDPFGPVRERLKNPKGRLRKMGADYLAYSLLDAVVDNYFVVLEKLGERLESLEERLIAAPEPRTLTRLHRMRREMIHLRRSIWPLREAVIALERSDSPFMNDSTRIYLADVHDHTVQAIDTIETFRDMLTGMLDLYLSSVSNRLNSVMKVLTIIATIFMPLTFLAGVYGMNFQYMPELQWQWGYFAVWIVMIVTAVFMLICFRIKKWI